MLERRGAMPEVQPQTNPAATPQGDAPDPLAGLYHMSTTAGVGTQEYVAINPTAIAALALGLVSVLAMFSDILLVIPLAGLICAILALVQIRSSNGTQTGTGLAILGLVLSIAVGGGRGGYAAYTSLRTTADERQIAQIIHNLGQDVAKGDYAKAYGSFTQAFQDRVDLPKFEQAFKEFSTIPQLGPVESIEWNQQSVYTEAKPDTGVVLGYAMALFKHANNPYPRRLIITFEKSGGVWRPSDIESMFPTKKPQGQQ
jgi:hypothetical protein